jgi:hypothetical protein
MIHRNHMEGLWAVAPDWLTRMRMVKREWANTAPVNLKEISDMYPTLSRRIFSSSFFSFLDFFQLGLQESNHNCLNSIVIKSKYK